MNLYQVTIGARGAPRLSFPVVSPDSCTATAQHLALAQPGERVDVVAIPRTVVSGSEGLSDRLYWRAMSRNMGECPECGMRDGRHEDGCRDAPEEEAEEA